MGRPIVVHKHTQEGWHDTFNVGKERGVRAEGGFICFLPRPSHYSGQDERYERELEEYKANAKLISKAPELLQIAEAFYDSMVGTDAEGGLQFGIVEKVLKEINPK